LHNRPIRLLIWKYIMFLYVNILFINFFYLIIIFLLHLIAKLLTIRISLLLLTVYIRIFLFLKSHTTFYFLYFFIQTLCSRLNLLFLWKFWDILFHNSSIARLLASRYISLNLYFLLLILINLLDLQFILTLWIFFRYFI
jgi:hypothetical protein